MQPNIRATAIIKVQGLAAIPAATTSANGLPVDWPMSGCVLWIVGSVVGLSTNDLYVGGMSSIGFRIQVSGRTELITNGQSADYLQFASAFPNTGMRMPVGINVKQGDRWSVYLRNLHAATVFTPDLAFGIAESQ